MSRVEWELEERTFDWNDRVRKENSTARGVLVDLEEFFREADEEIAGDPNDPRDGLGRLPGLGRLVSLAHCVLDRLEEDIERGLVSLPMGMEEGAENGHRYLDALGAMQRAFKAVLVWYDRDDVDWAVRLTSAALESAGEFREKNRAGSGGRIFSDLVRISPDFRILLGLFQDIQENRSTRPEHPEADESWSVDRWLQYYRERCLLEEPMIAVVDAEGFSRESLAKGMKIMEEESERLDRRGEEFLERHRLMKNRDAAFDPDRPGVFLELPELPDVEDDEEHDVEPIDVGDENDEPPSSWASSIPELAAWESGRQKRSLESTGTERRHDFRSDPVYQLLRSFSLALFSLLRQEAPGPASGEGPEKTPRRSPLDHYLTLLVLKAQARISSSRVFSDSVGHPAPRQGAILFATECLGKIAEAVEKFAPTHLRSLSGQARDTRRQLIELLDGE